VARSFRGSMRAAKRSADSTNMGLARVTCTALSQGRTRHRKPLRSRFGSARPVMQRLCAALGVLSLLVVASVPMADEPMATSSPLTIWDGIYTEAQALRGRDLYAGPCGRCHGARLDGAPDDPDMFPSPPIGGWKFLRNWNGRTLAVLYDYTRTTMPANNPGFLSVDENLDLIAYMLWASGAPAGPGELSQDPVRLSRIVILPQPASRQP